MARSAAEQLRCVGAEERGEGGGGERGRGPRVRAESSPAPHLGSLHKQQRQRHDRARHSVQVQGEEMRSLLERGALGARAQRLQRLAAELAHVLLAGQARERSQVAADALIDDEQRHGVLAVLLSAPDGVWERCGGSLRSGWGLPFPHDTRLGE